MRRKILKGKHHQQALIGLCAAMAIWGGCTDSQSFEAQRMSEETSDVVLESVSEEGSYSESPDGKAENNSEGAVGKEDLKLITNYGETEEKIWLDGTSIVSAVAKMQDDTHGNKYYLVEIQFDEEGTKIFHDVTRIHQGERISIVQGDKVLSSPVVQQPIADGKVVITGLESWQQAYELSLSLGSVENAQAALLEQGKLVISLLNEKLHNDSYLELMGTASLTEGETFAKLRATDYQEAEKVYQITLSGDAWGKLFALMSDDKNLLNSASEELKSSLGRQMLESFVTLMVSRMGDSKTVALQSILMAERLFVEPTAKNEESIFLYVFEGAYPISVSFTGSQDGAVKAVGRFVLIDDIKTDSERELMESLLMGLDRYYAEINETLGFKITRID